MKLETVQAYPEDYTETTEVAKAELEANARPELSTVIENMDDYDTIYLGYPIWWHYAPMAINTFIESYDLSGKTIIPFCTSASSGIEESVESLCALYPNYTILDGLKIRDVDAIQAWIDSLTSEQK